MIRLLTLLLNLIFGFPDLSLITYISLKLIPFPMPRPIDLIKASFAANLLAK